MVVLNVSLGYLDIGYYYNTKFTNEMIIEVCEDCPYNTHPCPEGCSKKIENNKHGGKRVGSGAKKKLPSEKKEPTKVMRVPISKVDEITNILKNK